MTKPSTKSLLIWILLFQFIAEFPVSNLAIAEATHDLGQPSFQIPLAPPPSPEIFEDFENAVLNDPTLDKLKQFKDALSTSNPLKVAPNAPNVFGVLGRKHIVYNKDGRTIKEVIDLDRG